MLVLIITLSITGVAYAKTRNTYLNDFMLDHLVEDKGFTNSNREDYREDSDDISYEATAYALEILKDNDLLEERDWFGKVTTSYNSSDLQERLEDVLQSRYQSGYQDIYETYFILKSLNNMDYELSSTLAVQIQYYLGSTLQATGGYSGSDSSTSPNIISTYFSLAIYDLLDIAYPALVAHKSFVRSCYHFDGGYGGDASSSSTLTTTYYAVLIADLLEDLDLLYDERKTNKYINSFYVGDENDEDNYGGFLPDMDAEHALISSTYYSVKAITLMDDGDQEDKKKTAEWLLNRQNFQDGGFVDMSDGYEQRFSSVVNSYYAYEAVNILGRGQLLEEKVFQKEFEWFDWIILVSILGGIVALAIYGIIVWRKRKI